MPDTDHKNPSASVHAPTGWGDAFAALPMETPPSGGWQRVSRAIDAPAQPLSRARRARWPMWLAAAATVSAVALVPVLMRETPPAGTVEVARTTTPPVATPPAKVATPGANATPTPSHEAAVTDTVARAPVSTPRNKRRPSPTTPPHEAAPKRLVAAESTPPSTGTTASDIADLHALQAQSAQLETLVALARDDRVATASSAALTVELDERIGRIDASLSQPGLGDAERASLWRERVATMRELAGIETTRRWMTASGERYDGALVSVD